MAAGSRAGRGVVLSRSDDGGASWQEGVVHQINNVLYQNRTHLRGAFRMLDTAGTGKISARAFEHTLRNINGHLDKGEQLSDLQIRELRRCLDRGGRGVVTYDLRAPRVARQRARRRPTTAWRPRPTTTRSNDTRVGVL